MSEFSGLQWSTGLQEWTTELDYTGLAWTTCMAHMSTYLPQAYCTIVNIIICQKKPVDSNKQWWQQQYIIHTKPQIPAKQRISHKFRFDPYILSKCSVCTGNSTSSDLCWNNEHVCLEVGNTGNITMLVDIAVIRLYTTGLRRGEFLPLLMTDQSFISGLEASHLSTTTAHIDIACYIVYC